MNEKHEPNNSSELCRMPVDHVCWERCDPKADEHYHKPEVHQIAERPDEHLYPHQRCGGCGEVFETTNQRLTHNCHAIQTRECVKCGHGYEYSHLYSDRSNPCSKIISVVKVSEAQLAAMHQDMRDEAGVTRCGCKCEFATAAQTAELQSADELLAQKIVEGYAPELHPIVAEQLVGRIADELAAVRESSVTELVTALENSATLLHQVNNHSGWFADCTRESCATAKVTLSQHKK